MKFSHFPLSKYIVNIITCCILLYSLNGYCHGRRTFRWLNQFSTYQGEVEPNPCGWKVLASYISKAPWIETPNNSFFDNISPLPEICSFSENYPAINYLRTNANRNSHKKMTNHESSQISHSTLCTNLIEFWICDSQ